MTVRFVRITFKQREVFMKRIALALALARTATAVSAQSGPTTQAMTCNQALSIVASQGAVVLHTGPTTYDQFVRDSSFCFWPNVAQPARGSEPAIPQCAP